MEDSWEKSCWRDKVHIIISLLLPVRYIIIFESDRPYIIVFFPSRAVNRHSECALVGNVVAMIKRTLSEYVGEDYHVDGISTDDDDGADYGLTITYHI